MKKFLEQLSLKSKVEVEHDIPDRIEWDDYLDFDSDLIPLGMSKNGVIHCRTVKRNVLIRGEKDVAKEKKNVKSLFIKHALNYSNDWDIWIVDLEGDFENLKNLPNVRIASTLESAEILIRDAEKLTDERVKILDKHDAMWVQTLDRSDRPKQILLIVELTNELVSLQLNFLNVVKYGANIGITSVVSMATSEREVSRGDLSYSFNFIIHCSNSEAKDYTSSFGKESHCPEVDISNFGRVFVTELFGMDVKSTRGGFGFADVQTFDVDLGNL